MNNLEVSGEVKKILAAHDFTEKNLLLSCEFRHYLEVAAKTIWFSVFIHKIQRKMFSNDHLKIEVLLGRKSMA